MLDINREIERLIQYGLRKELIEKWDIDYVRNRLLEVLELDSFQVAEVEEEELDSPVGILDKILDWAFENNRLTENTVTYRDLLDTKLMGCITPRTSEVIHHFYEMMEENNPQGATKYLYDLSKAVDYVRTDRIAKNEHWYTETEYGALEITINLSKPEKDPKAIAAAKGMKQSGYPKCLLCKENVGYAGRVNHPARQNLRTIPIELDDRTWHLQFSPYVYYNEHAIVLLDEHEPMKISKATFKRLLEFVSKLPHYFLGSNADLPIVGGSILSHDHFQGGHHDFPMAKAEMETEFRLEGYPHIKAGIVKWPMSVIRLQGENRGELVELADKILHAWRGYTDESAQVYAFTGDTPHNTITPIARRRSELFELDLVLRNNRTNEDHPLGIFHPHQEVHHIKKENIGLIEVMGLAVLPGRLQEELRELANALLKEDYEAEIQTNDKIAKHIVWAKEIKAEYPDFNKENGMNILRNEVGLVFSKILGHAGVFKRDVEGKKAFLRFVDTLKS